ncbi:MAG: hypothetical protein NDI61_07500 [Bdellovibrionaceae bacterium]|nr:hypothetical protein [Pseudobdellovibrionaceae bacterium]
MVKLKKALKKLAKLGAASGTRAAKKGAPVKKKTGPIPTAKKKAPAAAPKAAKKAAKAPAKKVEAASKLKKPVPAPLKKANGKAAEGSGKESGKAKKITEKPMPVVAKAKTPGKVEKIAEKPADKPADKTPPKAARAAGGEAMSEKGRKVSKEAPSEVEVQAGAEAPLDDEGPEEVILTDAEGRRYCRVKDCDQLSMVDGYCRYHYLLFWKRIQVRKKILTEGKLERYIEELTARYPDKYLEMLRKDLKTEKDFLAAITELEIDETSVDSEYEDEAQSYLEEVRGMSSETSSREEEEF